MEHKPRMIANVSTQLKPTQQLIQYLQVLAMDAQQLHDHLYDVYTSNPMVELTYQHTPSSGWMAGRGFDADRVADRPFEDPRVDLRLQVETQNLSDDERCIVDFCLEAMEDNGFLDFSEEEIASLLSLPQSTIHTTLQMLRTLNPFGVFLEGIPQFFEAQLIARGVNEPKLIRLLHEKFDLLLQGNAHQVMRELDVTSEEYQSYLKMIKELQRYPIPDGQEEKKSAAPEIIVRRADDQWEIRLINDWVGKISLNEEYEALYHETRDGTLKEYLRGERGRAKQVMSYVEDRNETILRITACILRKQEAYLLSGDALQPLRQQDIADELELSTSTVSRATRGKSMQFERKVYALADFFSAFEFKNDEKAAVSGDRVKEEMVALINKEDRSKPVSDEDLRMQLERMGISASRRVLAKYRKELGIPSSVDRKHDTRQFEA